MSKLFDQVAGHFHAKHRDVQYLITALNPFLGFRGSIFLGSSYIPFATSPMAYNYSAHGLYLNRRNAGDISVRQRYVTPPIVWLARSLRGGGPQRALENAHRYYRLGDSEYQGG
jgi:hypothetical protein